MTSAPASQDAGGPDPETAVQLSQLRDAKVEEWVRLIRFGDVVPLSVEQSLSWRVTRPLRLGQTAVRVLRRDGVTRFWATVNYRLRRLARRR